MENEADSIFSILIKEKDSDQRLDTFLSSQRSDLTRSRIQDLIKDGFVQVNNRFPKSSYRLKRGDRILLKVPPAEVCELEPERIDFDLVFEDASLIVLNKPPGLVVHPAPGHSRGTLVHGLIAHCRDLSGIGGILRPGIVHRLDKDTSGLIVVAKSDRVHHMLSKQFSEGKVRKRYIALIYGRPVGDRGTIEGAIGRHPRKRKEMAVVSERGRQAITLWEKVRTFGDRYSLLSVSPKTGRTHQIRVHLAYLGYPIVGDAVYGQRGERRKIQSSRNGCFPKINRQMLHAGTLGFIHPDSMEYCEFVAPLPEDMKAVIAYLETSFPEAGG